MHTQMVKRQTDREAETATDRDRQTERQSARARETDKTSNSACPSSPQELSRDPLTVMTSQSSSEICTCGFTRSFFRPAGQQVSSRRSRHGFVAVGSVAA
jgi:hypothetical protein